MGNSQRSRTVYSVGEAIRLQRETLRFCAAMFNEPYLDAQMRQSLRTEITRALNLTVAVEPHLIEEMGSASIVPLCVKKRLPFDPDVTCYCHDCFPGGEPHGPSPDGSAKRRDVKQARPEGQQPDQLQNPPGKSS